MAFRSVCVRPLPGTEYPASQDAGSTLLVGGEDEKKILGVSSTVLSQRNGALLRRSTVNGKKIRSRLLNRLGIVEKPDPTTTSGGGSKVSSSRLVPVVRKVPLLSEPLKYDEEDNCEDEDDGLLKQGSHSCSSDNSGITISSSTTGGRRSVVAFDEEVSVVPIPKHQEYSNRIRSRLWSDKRELRRMAARNTLEYRAEGWNPSTVIEDEGFITMSTGERIHPVHFQRLLCTPFFSQSFR